MEIREGIGRIDLSDLSESHYKTMQPITGKTKMKYSDIKHIKSFCENLCSNPSWREVVHAIENYESDFEIDGVRFIEDGVIMDVLINELSNDKYILGCFNAWCIADATGWPIKLIEAAKSGEQYEAIGEAMTDEHIAKLAEIYAANDGYGHHFNHYDGDEYELFINGQHYHVFDNRD